MVQVVQAAEQDHSQDATNSNSMAAESAPQPQMTLYRGWESPGAYVWSPFVTKVELRLRLDGLSYRTEAGSLSKAPKGKIPYLAVSGKGSDNIGPSILSDSTLIIEKLVEDGLVQDFNAKLSPTERAHDLALRALLEDKLYFYHTFERWHQNYYTMRPHILSALPYSMQVVVGWLIHRKSMQTLHGQGTGRFSEDEIRALRQQIWGSINDLLVSARKNHKSDDVDVPFWVLGGDRPSEADTVLFGFIVSVLVCTAAPESNKVVRDFPVVLEYTERIHNRYFPDYAHWE